MTEEEVARKTYGWIMRSYQTISLANKKDKDVYDVLYNVAKDLSVISYSYVKELQDFAVECKNRLVNPDVVQFAKDLDFGNVESIVIDVYSRAIPEYIQKQLGCSSYDARQCWLAVDSRVLKDLGQ